MMNGVNGLNRFLKSNKVEEKRESISLSRLVFDQRWDKVQYLLRNGTSLDPDCSSLDIPSTVPDDKMLHYVCRFDPPLHIVQLISMKYKSSIEARDTGGRYPIHVAAKYGASPDIIEYLIKTNPPAAGIQDMFGKTPMHYVGECYSRCCCAYTREETKACTIQAARLLKDAAPDSANLVDFKGMNAIEYALESDTDMLVIKVMQRACRDDWKKRKAEHKEKCHEELETELGMVSSRLHEQIETRRLRHPRRKEIKGFENSDMKHPGVDNGVAARLQRLQSWKNRSQAARMA